MLGILDQLEAISREQKVCTSCLQPKDLSAFGWRDKARTKLESRCRRCKADFSLNYWRQKQKVVDK